MKDFPMEKSMEYMRKKNIQIDTNVDVWRQIKKNKELDWLIYDAGYLLCGCFALVCG